MITRKITKNLFYHSTQFVISHSFIIIKYFSLIDHECETPSLLENFVSIENGLSYLNLKYILCKIDITKDLCHVVWKKQKW